MPDRTPATNPAHPRSGAAAAHHQAATIFPGGMCYRSRLRATQPPVGFLRWRQLPGSFLQRRKVALRGKRQLRWRPARRARPPRPPRGWRRHYGARRLRLTAPLRSTSLFLLLLLQLQSDCCRPAAPLSSRRRCPCGGPRTPVPVNIRQRLGV